MLAGASGCPGPNAVFHCEANSDCASGNTCRDGVCRRACVSTDECPASETCDQGACLAQVTGTAASSNGSSSGSASTASSSWPDPSASSSSSSVASSSAAASTGASVSSSSASVSSSSGGGVSSSSSSSGALSSSSSGSGSLSSSTSSGGRDAGAVADAGTVNVVDAGRDAGVTQDAGGGSSGVLLPRGGVDPVLWLVADTVVATPEGVVQEWPDSSGLDHHAYAQETRRMPTLVPNLVAGHAAVLFDGEEDEMLAPNVVAGTMGRSVVVVAWALRIAERNVIVELNNDNNAGGGETYAVTPEVSMRAWGREVYDQSLGTTGFRLMTAATPAQGRIEDTRAWLERTELNVASDFNESDGLDTGTGPTCVGYSDLQQDWNGGDPARFQGYIAELIVYDHELSDAERTAVIDELMAVYGLGVP
ncbi:MAG: hypothetical protein AB2A00_35820 [Myxococcota bacterium]